MLGLLKTWVALSCVAFLSLGCGTATSPLSEPLPRLIDSELDGASIGGVIEPENALVDDFGDGWEESDRWYVEGVAEVDSGCAEWDALALIDDWGGTMTQWTGREAELSLRVADLNFGAAAYVGEAGRLPQSCPNLALNGSSVAVTALDSFSDEVTWFKLSAYPLFDQETTGVDPRMDDSREAWFVFAHRFNVVSRLVVSSGNGIDETAVRSLAQTMRASLDNAPTEGVGSVSPPEGPPMFEAGVFPEVIFETDATCRNAGRVQAGGVSWRTNEDAAVQWEGKEVPGRLEVDGSEAVFASDDGTQIPMTTGAVLSHCSLW